MNGIKINQNLEIFYNLLIGKNENPLNNIRIRL